jgi:hypothetical protein
MNKATWTPTLAPQKIARLTRRLIKDHDQPYLLLVLFDANGTLLTLDRKDQPIVDIEATDVLTHACTIHAAGLLMIHNHWKRILAPST